MTRQQIILRAMTHPAVVKAHTRYVGGQPMSPDASMLEALADGWIDTVIEEMLGRESLRRAVSQQSYNLTFTGAGTYTLPVNIGRVLDITGGEDNKPYHNFVTISDYNRWRYEVNPNADSNDETVGYYFPSRDPSTQALKVTFVHADPGSGTGVVWFLSQSEPPYSLSVFPSNIHHVIMQGVLAKMTGFDEMEQMFQTLMANAGRQLTPRVGGYSRAGTDPRWRMKNWRRSNMPGGGLSSGYYPPHRSN